MTAGMTAEALHRPGGTDDHGSSVGGVDASTHPGGHPTDRWAALYYLDRFERRQGEWRIEERACASDGRRTDRVDGEGGSADSDARGIRSPDDIVHRILDGSRG